MLPAVLREERQFRLLFAGQALSIIGDRITVVVMPFAVLSIGGSTTDVGIVAAAGFVPFIVLGLIGGVIADRFERRRIMVLSDLVRLATQLTAGILLVAGHAEVWHLAALTALFGAADSFFIPAMGGLMPQTIDQPHHLQPANALRSMSVSTGMIIGPVIGGLLVALAGEGTALIVDAGTFLASVVCLLALRPRVVERAEAPEPFLTDLKGGWHEVRTRTWVWSFLLAMVVYHVVVLPSIFVLGPVLMEEELDGAKSWAIITTAFGLGAILGDVVLMKWRPRFALRAAAIGLGIASCQAVILGSGLPIAAIAALEFCAAIGVSLSFTFWETSLQEHIPEASISRVTSYDYAVSAGMIPLGVIAAGPVSEAIGIHETLAGMTVVGILAAIACLAVPAVRNLPRGGGSGGGGGGPGKAAPAPAAP
jgi:MFS family permease